MPWNSQKVEGVTKQRKTLLNRKLVSEASAVSVNSLPYALASYCVFVFTLVNYRITKMNEKKPDQLRGLWTFPKVRKSEAHMLLESLPFL